MLTNANIKDALDIAGQSLGERQKDNSFCLQLMLIGLLSYLFFPALKRKSFVTDMNIVMIRTLIHDL